MKTKRKSGWAFHVHHDILVEWCYDYDERVRGIKNKPLEEQELRLRLFRFIPKDRVPAELAKAREAYVKAREACAKASEACVKAREAYVKAREACVKASEAYANELELLHPELCPDCPWDGHTIFPSRKEEK